MHRKVSPCFTSSNIVPPRNRSWRDVNVSTDSHSFIFQYSCKFLPLPPAQSQESCLFGYLVRFWIEALPRMSDRLEELRATFVIEGIDECLQLVQEFEKTDPKAAKKLVNDALGSLPEQDVIHGPLVGFAISVIRGAYGAFMGRSNAEPDVLNAVIRITADVRHRLQSGRSILPDPAPKLLSDRLEELHMAFLSKNQQIPGVEECLELLRELETKDPTAAQTLLDDAFSSVSASDNSIASTAMSLAHGAFGAVMGRSSARPATFPLQKEPEIDYTEAMLVVKSIAADVKHRLLELEPRLSHDAVASSDGGSQGPGWTCCYCSFMTRSCIILIPSRRINTVYNTICKAPFFALAVHNYDTVWLFLSCSISAMKSQPILLSGLAHWPRNEY